MQDHSNAHARARMPRGVAACALRCGFALAALGGPGSIQADIDPIVDILTKPGSAALGALLQVYPSPYVGAETQVDLLPLYLFEGERVFMSTSRWGIKLLDQPRNRLDLILDYRFEGFPAGALPDSLADMETREATADLGLAYTRTSPYGSLHLELVHDAFSVNQGSEARVGYSFNWTRGRLTLRPTAMLYFRSAELNDYYYGVRPEEARPDRPAYQADAGMQAWLGLYGYYRLTRGWWLIGGGGVQYLGEDAQASPIVASVYQPAAFVGAAYDFGSYADFAQQEGRPFYLKVLYGQSSGCTLFKITTARCASLHDTDDTDIVGVQIGKPFAERVKGWPLDFVGYIGLIRHLDKGLQDDSWELDLFMKAFFYGFPWDEQLRTRLGFGFGLSVAERIPYTEQTDADANGELTSKLLNYIDLTVDFSIGDVLQSKKLATTYLGLGVSHRSGLFGSAQIFGNVYGGSNYFYLYLETRL